VKDSLTSWQQQKKAWKLLKGLNSKEIDLSVVDLIRRKKASDLLDPVQMEALLLQLGFNDEGLDEFPEQLHAICGQGLRIWQYPIQFVPYLIKLCELKVTSYLEIGIRHGGSYVATTEILQRFQPLQFSVGVDIIPCKSMSDYKALNSISRFLCVNSRGEEFKAHVQALSPIDLVFIDSHHEEEQCRLEFLELKDHANMIAFHDIANKNCPGVATIWQEILLLEEYQCFEFTAQYPNLGPFMGIGLAVKKQRLSQHKT
jgi:hypothetical protein